MKENKNEWFFLAYVSAAVKVVVGAEEGPAAGLDGADELLAEDLVEGLGRHFPGLLEKTFICNSVVAGSHCVHDKVVAAENHGSISGSRRSNRSEAQTQDRSTNQAALVWWRARYKHFL